MGEHFCRIFSFQLLQLGLKVCVHNSVICTLNVFYFHRLVSMETKPEVGVIFAIGVVMQKWLLLLT